MRRPVASIARADISFTEGPTFTACVRWRAAFFFARTVRSVRLATALTLKIRGEILIGLLAHGIQSIAVANSRIVGILERRKQPRREHDPRISRELIARPLSARGECEFLGIRALYRRTPDASGRETSRGAPVHERSRQATIVSMADRSSCNDRQLFESRRAVFGCQLAPRPESAAGVSAVQRLASCRAKSSAVLVCACPSTDNCRNSSGEA